MAKPWFKFYPGSWRSDAALRLCSMGARALWIELLCIMDEANPRGRLLVNGERPSPKQIASLAGCDSREAVAYLRELEDRGVFSRTSDGVIFSRKMVRETRVSTEQSGRARKRWNADSAEELDLGRPASDAKENREQNLDVREIATAIWDATPPIAKKRSSRAQLDKALQAAVHRGKNPAVIRQAVASYFADPDTCREDHKFAKGVHRVVQNDFWETWAQAAGLEHLDGPEIQEIQRSNWRKQMGYFQAGEEWNRLSLGPRPDEPGCRIPLSIMAEFDYTPPTFPQRWTEEGR